MKTAGITKKWELPRAALTLVLVSAAFSLLVRSQSNDQKLEITANLEGRQFAQNEALELKLNRAPRPEEGQVSVLVNETDVTAVLQVDGNSLRYPGALVPLPVGVGKIRVYLVDGNGVWTRVSEFPIEVTGAASPIQINRQSGEASAEGDPRRENEENYEFTPNVTINIKGQNQNLTFPRENAPERNPFTDVAGQGGFTFKIGRSGWALQMQSDFAGSSYRQEALRFGELGIRAPRIDLSSYLVQLTKGRFGVRLGHVSFGSNRHLINSFSSRGITITVPVGRQNEISFGAANGTSVVGFGNFFGVNRRKHNVVSSTFVREFLKERPNGLRLEVSVMRGSLLPLTNVNQNEVNDAERSLGFGLKLIGSDRTQRIRYEVGFTRSRFTNPQDPQLEQGMTVIPVRATTRNARYADISFDFIRDLALWREKKLKLTGTYRHEEIEPLFRSVVTATQADRRNHQFEVNTSFGEMNFVYGNLRDRDNLADIASILRSLTRRNNAVFNIALNSFFTPTKPIKWLPQVSYLYDHVHNFGVALPSAGLFNSASQAPDQESFNRTFNAQWQISDGFRLGYRLSRAFQDNKQPGRERSDFLTKVNALTFGTKPFEGLDLNLDLSRESLENLEQGRIDETFRLGSNLVWLTPFLKNSTLNANVSTTLAGDRKNTSDTRNVEFDIQWSYRFDLGSKKFKKQSTQFFIRYANRYGDVRDRILFADTFNKTQTFNAGLTFNIF